MSALRRTLTLRRAAPFAAVVLLFLGGVAFVRNKPLVVTTVPVARGTVVRETRGAGTLESEAVVQMAFTLQGRIRELRVSEGSVVRAGDVLAVLDADEHQQQVQVAKRSVELASAGAEKSNAEVARAKAVLSAAELDHERVRALHASGAVAQAELDGVRERMARARAELAAAEAAVRQGASGVAVARETMQLQAQRSDETVLHSPLDGLVVRRLREPGDVVGPGQVVLVVASTKKIWARTWLDETVLHELAEGQPARVVLRGDPSRSYAARVDRLAVEADRNTHELLVDLELLERPTRIVFGQRLDGFVELERRDDVVRVPAGVCGNPADPTGCYVAREREAVRTEPTLGVIGREWVEVKQGLAVGDLVVVPPTDPAALRDGRRLRVRPTP